MTYLNDALTATIDGLSPNELREIWNVFCERDHRYEDEVYDMWELDDMLRGKTASDILDMTRDSFSTGDQFWTMNYYELCSSDDITDFVDVEELVDYMEENRDGLGNMYCEETIEGYENDLENCTVDSDDYINYQKGRQQSFDEWCEKNAFFAFNQEQFDEGMRSLGLDPSDHSAIRHYGYGMYYLASAELPKKDDRPLNELMKDEDFAVGAFYYEMSNHEYAINLQGDWDVCSCFTDAEPEYGSCKDYADYLAEGGYGPEVIGYYKDARIKYMRYCELMDLG